MVVKIYIENYGSIFGKDTPEALNKLDRVMQEKFNDSVPKALARANGNGRHRYVNTLSGRKNRAGGEVDPVFRRYFMRRRRG